MRRFSVKEMVYLTLGAGAGEDTILWMSEKALGPGVNWGNSLARQKMCAQLRGRSGPHHVLSPGIHSPQLFSNTVPSDCKKQLLSDNCQLNAGRQISSVPKIINAVWYF